MANALYPKWKEQLLQFTANNNLSAGTVKVALVTAGYTYASTDQFYSAVSASVVGTPQTIGSKTFTNGTFSGGNVTFSAVTGAQVTKLVIYIDTGTAATSPLVAYLDTSVTGLPVTPNGGDITITWNASGIFTL
jgi:hypothetical protein